LGGFRAQGKTALAAQRLLEDAQVLAQAGCFSLVLESVPAQLAAYISQRINIPTIGIGAGADCDGQVLVTHDLLGLFERFTPKFVKQYAHLNAEMRRAFGEYMSEVQARQFPGAEHSLEMNAAEWHTFLGAQESQNEK